MNIEIGKRQEMRIDEILGCGAFLIFDNDDSGDRILLPNNQLTDDMKAGNLVEVFIYRDSEDRLIATCEQPFVEINQLAVLKVVSNTKIGTFMDWGLVKDLFVPYREQNYEMEEGKSYLVYLYLDKSERICATTRVSRHLSIGDKFEKGDKVKGIVYDYSYNKGYYVAIENKFKGFIPSPNKSRKIKIGDQLELYVIRVKEDGKIDLSVFEGIMQQMDKDSETILNRMKSQDGLLFLNDKSSPKKIRRKLAMSKNSFKKATGKMYKQQIIEKTENGWKISD